MSADAERIEELRQIVEAIKQRVRVGQAASDDSAPVRVTPADLMPIVHARDAAQAKIAAIGSVNPRAGGALNTAIQIGKKAIARSLKWFVREQVVYNREILAAIEGVLEALHEHNRAIVQMAAQTSQQIRRQEEKVTASEIHSLRGVAELQGSFQHRVTQMESNFREMLAEQHANYRSALDRSGMEIQKRLWADLEDIRSQHERMIHAELRVLRQRMRSGAISAAPAPAAPLETLPEAAFDYQRFAERFRGDEEFVRKSQNFYRSWFEGRQRVLDIGCGRGEFLELMREMGVPALGIDFSAESVAECRAKGLKAEAADLFAFLDAAPDFEFDGIFCSQVVEHLDPMQLPRMVALCGAKLATGGVIAFETPNPECLAIFGTFFYLDPTHTRPVPRELLDFYMTEAGLTGIQAHLLSPAEELFPEIADLPEAFRKRFFGGMDYAMIGRKR